jgi:ketosteroid isomerase-like protein
VEDQYFAVWTLRDGQAVAYREYMSKREALQAVGLSE